MKFGRNWLINAQVGVSTHVNLQAKAILVAILVIVHRTIPTDDLWEEFDESNPYMKWKKTDDKK